MTEYSKTLVIWRTQVMRGVVRLHNRIHVSTLSASVVAVAFVRATLVFAIALLVVCHAYPQTRLVPVDTVWLSEYEDSFLALPIALHVDLDGYLVTDGQQPQVIRYSASGDVVQMYGSEGEGPGEFREAQFAMPYDGQDVAVFSCQPLAVNRFNRESGKFVRRYRLERIPQSALLSGDTVWLGGINYTDGVGVERLSLGETESILLAPLPDSYVSGGPVGGIFPHVSVARWDDTLVVGYEPDDQVLVLTSSGTLVETIELPSKHRRGVPANLEARLLEAMRDWYPEVFGLLSALRGLHRLSDGATAVVHFDSRAEPPPVTSEVFVSLLAPDRRTACLDARIPLGPDARPVVSFASDTMLVLEQQVGVGLEASVFIARYVLDTSGCAWTPTAIRSSREQ